MERRRTPSVPSRKILPSGICSSNTLQIMLHEIILSLSGHPSPLLTNSASNGASNLLSPPEKALLASIAHLSDLHCKLLSRTENISSNSCSSICQAVATSIKSTHLAQFQQKVLDVENGILRRDSSSVGAYNIVPLTAVAGQFSEWSRRMEWLWEVTKFMGKDECTGSRIINKLRVEMKTGYSDIEQVALSLVRVAESAWLKQASCWVLYGRLPTFGKHDFFVHQGENGEYEIKQELLPDFANKSVAGSILFVGKSLNQIRTKNTKSANSINVLLPKHLRLLSSITYPISSSNLSTTLTSIRRSLSQCALQELLPLAKIQQILSLFRDFFLLSRGEFAIALVHEADEKIRTRWRRSENLAFEKRNGLSDVVVKDGEVSAVLTRTWASLSALHGLTDDDDDQLEMARNLIDLRIVKPLEGDWKFSKLTPSTPFDSLLLSVPTALTLKIPSPLDLFITSKEVDIYAQIHTYLLSIRRAHLRLSDLWKITSLRRDHPSPPPPPQGSTARGRVVTKTLRMRGKLRSKQMRNVWATSSAALYLLGELKAYFHNDVLEGTWESLQEWLTGSTLPSFPIKSSAAGTGADETQDIWAAAGEDLPTNDADDHSHDPQTLSAAHQRYLLYLKHQLLITTPSFTEPLFSLLQYIDHLVALVHRMHSVWSSLDLEVDEGVVDAFSDFHKEEKQVGAQLVTAAQKVKDAINCLVISLREIDLDVEGRENRLDQLEAEIEDVDLSGEEIYKPKKVGRVDRLLIKLDFGGWLAPLGTAGVELDGSPEQALAYEL